jgi:hypothetical protein
MKITKRCKIKFSINVEYANELECEITPLDACEVIFGNPYLWDSDANFYMKENKYHLAKCAKAYFIKAHKGGGITPLIAMKQGHTNSLTGVNNK